LIKAADKPVLVANPHYRIDTDLAFADATLDTGDENAGSESPHDAEMAEDERESAAMSMLRSVCHSPLSSPYLSCLFLPSLLLLHFLCAQP
jgi:hypothetical protein